MREQEGERERKCVVVWFCACVFCFLFQCERRSHFLVVVACACGWCCGEEETESAGRAGGSMRRAMGSSGGNNSQERRLVLAMRNAANCSECSAAIPQNGRHAAPNLGVFTCNRCYGLFREGNNLSAPFNNQYFFCWLM